MAPTSIGMVAAIYHVDGTGDLNGDGRGDIIFRYAGGHPGGMADERHVIRGASLPVV
jgi:hypothetical protein